jgi:hypothetical protein
MPILPTREISYFQRESVKTKALLRILHELDNRELFFMSACLDFFTRELVEGLLFTLLLLLLLLLLSLLLLWF